MGKDIPLGRIAGIKVGMNISVPFLALFFTFMLATYQLPRLAPDHSDGAYWATGFAGALLLMLSLLAHEIGHALVARDEGIGVSGMALTIFGGVTRMESTPTTAGAEFRVSVVGPIASAACGIVFLVGSVLLPNDGTSGLIGALFAWAGFINLFLAALNMAPAAPLDGGKVLNAAIWRATGNQTTAMTWSAAIGIVIGMVATTWGFRRLTGDGNQDWALTAVIFGVFVAVGAYQQLRATPIYRALDGKTARDAMAVGPPSAPAWVTVGAFLRTATPGPDHQAYPVVGTDGQVWGLLTAAAIRATPPQSWDELPVTALAYPLDRLTLVRADEDLLSAFQKLESGDVRTGLVVSAEGQILGTLDPGALDAELERDAAGLAGIRG